MDEVNSPVLVVGRLDDNDEDGSSTRRRGLRVSAHDDRRRRQELATKTTTTAAAGAGTIRVIRVLLILTRRAACEWSNLDAGCIVTNAVLDSFTDHVPILVAQTNEALAKAGATAKIEIVATLHTGLIDDTTTTGEALDWLVASLDVARVRREHRADLVAVITHKGEDCGLDQLGGYASATAHNCLGGFTFTHELYVYHKNVVSAS